MPPSGLCINLHTLTHNDDDNDDVDDDDDDDKFFKGKPQRRAGIR